MEASSNSVVLIHARLEPTVKIRLASTVHSNALLVSVLPALALPVQMLNTCSKENALPNVQFHWSAEDVQTFAQADISLKPEAEIVSNVMTSVKLVTMLPINVLHVNQDLPATELVSLPAQPTL